MASPKYVGSEAAATKISSSLEESKEPDFED
jgi:hypothetical protein